MSETKSSVGNGIVPDQTNDNYPLTTQQVKVVTWTIDLTTGRFIFCSPSVEQLRGFTAEEILSQTLQDAVTPESMELISQILPKNIAAFEAGDLSAQSAISYIYQYHKNGSIIATEVATTLLKNEHGKVDKIAGISRDIAELQEAQDALRKSEERHRSLLDAIPDMLFRVTREGLIIDYKARSGEKLFMPPELFLGKYVSEVLPIDVGNQCMAELANAFKEDRLQVFRYPLVMDGYQYFYKARAIPDLQNNEAIFIIRDITEIKESEETVKRLSMAMEQTTDTVFITDKAGNIKYANNSLQQTYGYTIEELIGENPRIFKSGIKDSDFYATLWNTILSGEMFRAEVINKSKDGIYIYEDQVITPIKDENGQINSFLSVGRDITERKMAEIDVRRKEARFSNILQAAFDGFLIVNGQGKIIETNEEYCRMSGYTREELFQMTINDMEATMDDEEIVRRIELIKKHGRASFESEHIKKDGTHYPVEVRIMTSDVDGFTMVSFLKDITEEKKIIKELTIAKEEAETTCREKTNFLLNLDVEFRKPLSDIISCTDTLVEKIQTPEMKENVQIIASTSIRLRNKVDSILDMKSQSVKSGVTETPQQNS